MGKPNESTQESRCAHVFKEAGKMDVRCNALEKDIIHRGHPRVSCSHPFVPPPVPVPAEGECRGCDFTFDECKRAGEKGYLKCCPDCDHRPMPSVTVPASEGECPKCHGTKLAPGFATMPCPLCNPPEAQEKGPTFCRQCKGLTDHAKSCEYGEEDCSCGGDDKEWCNCPAPDGPYVIAGASGEDADSGRVLGPGLYPPGELWGEELTDQHLNIAYAQGLSAREEQLREAVRILKAMDGYLESMADEMDPETYKDARGLHSDLSALIASVKGGKG